MFIKLTREIKPRKSVQFLVKCDHCSKQSIKFLQKNKQTLDEAKLSLHFCDKNCRNASFKSGILKEKQTATYEKNGGHPFKRAEIRQKIIKTNLERYGFDNPIKNATVLKKVNKHVSINTAPNIT